MLLLLDSFISSPFIVFEETTASNEATTSSIDSLTLYKADVSFNWTLLSGTEGMDGRFTFGMDGRFTFGMESRGTEGRFIDTILYLLFTLYTDDDFLSNFSFRIKKYTTAFNTPSEEKDD